MKGDFLDHWYMDLITASLLGESTKTYTIVNAS